MSDLFVDNLKKLLPEELQNLNITHFDVTDSTNTKAAGLILSNIEKEGLVIADKQISGRGRVGRTFYSPKDTGCYFSYFFTPENNLNGMENATTIAAVCTAMALEKLYGIEIGIKWVNDLYFNGRKVCGILSEAITSGINRGSIIIGIGINVSTADFPDDIKFKAGSLPYNPSVTREQIIAAVMEKLYVTTKDLNDLSYVAEYRKRSFLIGKNISFLEDGIEKAAHVDGIDNTCGLMITFEDNSKRVLRNGEVSVLEN